MLPCCLGFCASNAHTTPEACRVQFKGVVAKVGGDHGFRASHLRARLHLQLLVPFFKFSSNSCFLFSRGPTPLAVFQLLMDLQELWGSHVSPFLLTTASAMTLEWSWKRGILTTTILTICWKYKMLAEKKNFETRCREEWRQWARWWPAGCI